MAEKFPFADRAVDIAAGTFQPTINPQQRAEMVESLLRRRQGGGNLSTLDLYQQQNPDGGPAVNIGDVSNYRVSGDTEFMDYPKGFAKGLVDIVGSVLGLAEMTGGIKPGTLTEGADKAAQKIVDSMTPSAQANLSRQWLSAGEDSVLRNPMAAVQQLATVAPSVLASIVPAAAVAGTASKLGAGVQAARAAGTAAGITSEAVQIGGATYNEVRNTVDNMTHAELLQYSPEYQKQFKKHGDEAEARREVLAKASKGPAAANAILGALVAGPGSYLAAKVGTGTRFGGTKAQRFGAGFALEGGEELAQEVPAALITGRAMQGAVDTRIDPEEGLAETALSSFMLGGGIGGPLGVLAGRRAPQDRSVPPEVAGAIEATQLELPLEDVPGEGAPGPRQPTALPEAPFPQAVPGVEPEQLQLPLGTAPETQGQFQYQTEMDFGPDQLPILPQDTSQPIAMPPGPGQQLEMQGLYDTGVGPVDQNRPLVPPPAQHVGEPIQDIEAQVVQMLDPETNKQAVYIDPVQVNDQYEGELNELMTSVQELISSKEVRDAYPEFGVAIDEHGGLVLATTQAAIDTYLAEGSTEQARAKLLGYQQSKDQFADPDRTLTVSKVNADGSVAESQVVDAEGTALTDAQLAYHMDLKEGQQVVVEPTGVSLERRQEQLELPLTNVTEQYSGVPTGREVDGRREGLKPQRVLRQNTEEERLERTLQQGSLRTTPEIEQKNVERMEREARGFKDTQPDTARVKRLYKEFKALFGDLLRSGAQNVTTGQGDLLQGPNQMFADLTPEQTQDIEDLLDQASTTQRTGIADRTGALEAIDEILGGNGDLNAVDSFVSLRKQTPGQQPEPEKEGPDLAEETQERQALERKERAGARRAFAAAERRRAKKAREQKKASRPIEAAADELLAEARQLEDRPPKQYKLRLQRKAERKKERPKRTETRRFKDWKAQDVLKYGAQQNTERMAQLNYRKRLLDAIRGVLMNTFGLSEEQARRFELTDRHLNLSFTLGRAARKDLGGKQEGRFSTFEKEMRVLELALDSKDPDAILNILERRGLDAIAKVLVMGELGLREAKAIAFVKRWRRNPAKLDLPQSLGDKLNRIYNRDVEGALGGELEQLIAEQQADDTTAVEQEGQAVGVDVTGTTDIAGNILEATTVEETPTEIERTSSGKSQSKGEKSPTPRRKKTESETELDRIVREDASGGPAPGAQPDGTGSDSRPVGELRVPKLIVGPSKGTPASVSSELFERLYPSLKAWHREGVQVFWQRIEDLWDKGSRSILGDGTGAGKTSQMVTIAHLFKSKFESEYGHPPRILIVTPNREIYRNFKKAADRDGTFVTREEGGSDKKIPVLEGVDHVNYNRLNTVTNEEYDLVIYDEAQNIARKNSWFDHHQRIKAKHTLYSTATPGDKESSLALLAATEGKTLQEFIKELAPEARVISDGEAGQLIDPTSIPDRLGFYKRLRQKVQKLADDNGYRRQELEREAEAKIVEVESYGSYKVTLSNGKKVSPAEAEDMLIRYLSRDDAPKLNFSTLWNASTKLGELAKLSKVSQMIDTALEENRQVVAMFYSQQQKDNSIALGTDPDGKPITLNIPIALRELEQQLKDKHGDIVTTITGKDRAEPRVKGFQDGKFRILLGTYEAMGAGIDLDANVPVEDGGWGRELILVSDPWGADVLDQAIGRVERASTKVTPVVSRLLSPDFQGDMARAEKLEYKANLQDALRGEVADQLYDIGKNIKVRELPGDVVAVRISGLPQGSKAFQALTRLLKARRGRYRAPTREHLLPKDAWDDGLRNSISQVLAVAGGTTAAPAEGTPIKAAKAKKVSKAKVVQESSRPDASPDLDALSMGQLAELEGLLLAKLDTVQGKEWESVNSALNDVYRAMERGAADKQSLSHADSGPYGTMELQRVVDRGLREKGVGLTSLLRRMARVEGLTPGQRTLLLRMARFSDRTQLSLATEAEMDAIGFGDSAGVYRGAQDHIFVSTNDATPETVVHETLHAVMHHAIRYDRNVRQTLEDLMNAVRVQFLQDADGLLLNEGEINQFDQALNDPDEFVSYGLTNEKINNLLKNTDAPRSALRKFIDAVLEFLGIRKKSQRKSVADAVEELVLKNMSHNRVADDLSYQMLSSRLGEPSMRAVEPILNMLNSSTAPQSPDQWRAAIRRKVLGLTTLRQIEKVYAHVLDRLPVGNPVRKWIEAMHRKEVTQKEQATLGNKMHREYDEAVTAEDGKHRKAIEQIVGQSTLYEAWVNKPLDHEDNAHLDAEGKAKWRELRKLYDSSPVVSKIYDRLFNYYANERKENFDLRIQNIVEAITLAGTKIYYVDERGIQTEITPDKAKVVAKNMRSKNPTYDPKNFVGKNEDGKTDLEVTGMLTEALRRDQELTLANGPYAPLKRFGDWVVSAFKDETTFTHTLTADEVAEAEQKARKQVEKLTDKKMEDFSPADLELYATELNGFKQKVLRRKLGELTSEKWGGDKSVERDAMVFDGDTGSQKSRLRYVSMRESEAQALRELEEIRKEGWQTVPNYVVTRKVSSATSQNAVNSALINHVRSKLGLGEKDGHPVLAALEASIIDLMPATSVRKEQLNRKGIFGFTDDHGRALASHVQSASWYRATLEHGQEISRGISDLTQAEKELHLNEGDNKYAQGEATMVGDVLREVRNHINLENGDDTLRPWVRGAGQIGFLWLLVSPAYVFVNMTQPLMYTLPWLKARQGSGMPAWRAFKNAYAAITPEIAQRAGAAVKQGATKFQIDPELFDFLQRGSNGQAVLGDIINKRLDDAVRNKRVTPEHLDGLKTMLEELSKNNVLDFTLALDTSAAAQGRAEGWNSRTMDVARIIPHLSEVLNRAVTAIAAYEMGRSQGMQHEKAVDFATDAVTETQFDYTLLNKPRFMSERYYALAKPVFMFMQHPQHVYALFVQTALTGGRYAKLKKSGAFDPENAEHRELEREWKQRRDTVVGVLATHMMAGGMTAAMFEPTKWALGIALMISEAISGEPPEETEVYVRRWMEGMFGENVGEIMANGLPAMFGAHLSDNLSIASLAFMNSPTSFSDGRRGVEEAVFNAAGPIPALIANVAQGISDAKEGDVLGGVARGMPRILREPLRAWGMANSGLRDSLGHEIISPEQLSPLELAWTSLGLKTRSTARAYERKTELDSLKNYHRKRRQRLQERLYRARRDARETQKVIRDIRKYNATVPPAAQVPTTFSGQKRKAELTIQDLGANLTRNEQWIADQ